MESGRCGDGTRRCPLPRSWRRQSTFSIATGRPASPYKALAEQLATGAIYHHIVSKRDLMAAAADAVAAEMQRTLVTMPATANAVLARWTAVRFSIG